MSSSTALFSGAKEVLSDPMDSLVNYIEGELHKGLAPAAIKETLKKAGHDEDIIDSALSLALRAYSLKKHRIEIVLLVLICATVCFLIVKNVFVVDISARTIEDAVQEASDSDVAVGGTEDAALTGSVVLERTPSPVLVPAARVSVP